MTLEGGEGDIEEGALEVFPVSSTEIEDSSGNWKT
jgi:hypothetical protein